MASQADIAYHYDVDNLFYQLFLDRKYRAYSCGVWSNAKTLEEAQHQKLARLSRFCGVAENHRVIDVGCGWGGMIEYLLDFCGVASVHGLTLSRDQCNFINERPREGVKVELRSWRDYEISEQKYDSVVSIGAFEHFASLNDREEDNHRQVYTEFFDWCRSISTNQALVGLQTIVTSRTPETLQEVRDTRYLLEKVFPGSALPAVADVQAAIQDKYEIKEIRKIGLDYARTLEEWRRRLHQNRNRIESLYGEPLFSHYDKYFLAAERSFRNGIVDLLQISLFPIKPSTILFNR